MANATDATYQAVEHHHQGYSGSGTQWNAPSGKYFGAGTALRQISLATGGTLTLKRSANHVVLVRLTRLNQFIFWPKLPPNAGFGIKNLQKISGGDTPGPCPAPTPSTATRYAWGRKLPRCWDLGLGNGSPNQNLPLHP